MIKTSKPIIAFGLKLAVAITFLFSAHIISLYKLNLALFDNKILLSYIVNYILAVAIYSLLYRLRIKFLDLLGFIYMAGSFVKFIFFFVFFYPSYRENGNMDVLEATSFMVPYVLCLFFETYYLIKLLNK